MQEGIIISFLTASVVYALYQWTNKQGQNTTAVSPGVTLLKNNISFAILGYVCAAMFVGLIVLVGFVGLGKADDFWLLLLPGILP